MTQPILLELPERNLSRHDIAQLTFAARYVCKKHPNTSGVGFHTGDKRMVEELQQRGIRTIFIEGDGVPGWWFIYAQDVLSRFGWPS